MVLQRQALQQQSQRRLRSSYSSMARLTISLASLSLLALVSCVASSAGVGSPHRFVLRDRSLHEGHGDEEDHHHDEDDEGDDDDDDDDKKQTIVRQYKLWKAKDITETVTRWAEHYPSLIRVTTAQEAYGLPTAGGDDDCPFDTDVVGCLNQILLIQDFEAHPEGSDSSRLLPEVLWSGEVHGNEQVGPTAVLEATQLLLDAATCEALPRMEVQQAGDPKLWELELEHANACRVDLEHKGIDKWHRQWLARLVTTRRLIVVPTANALGYFQKQRTENHIDPNRDFPYDVEDPADCMQTIAARTLNEVFTEHMVQLSLTFHGGMEVVGYEWGAPEWLGKTSPDDVAQDAISTAYSQYAGGFGSTPPYDHGPMNELVYPVHGGMEDWAYAASWDPERVVQCQPKTYGGYAPEKTKYDTSTLRVFNMLVETSNAKIPKQSDLGSSLELMTNSPVGNGHVARNIRLALTALELVEPYVAIRTVNELDLSDDLVPLTDRCASKTILAVPHNSRKVVVQWTVGGALDVNESSLYYVKLDANMEEKLKCGAQQPDASLRAVLQTDAIPIGSTTDGTTWLSKRGATAPFSASIDISNFAEGDRIAILASARVDQGWGPKLTDNVMPEVAPQSHVVNARTNADWRHEKPDQIIQGRLDWFSVPVTIVLTKNEKDASGQARVEVEETSMRYDETQFSKHAPPPSGGEPSQPAGNSHLVLVVGFVAVVCLVTVVGVQAYGKHVMRKTQRERLRDFIEDEDAVSPGLKDISLAEEDQEKAGYSDVVSTDDSKGELEMGTYA